MLQKPTPEVIIEALDYGRCAAYIEEKLGLKSKYSDLRGIENLTNEYRDFWHYVMDSNEVHNGCVVHIHEPYDDKNSWVLPIVKAFHEEFGEDAEYWVSW